MCSSALAPKNILATARAVLGVLGVLGAMLGVLGVLGAVLGVLGVLGSSGFVRVPQGSSSGFLLRVPPLCSPFLIGVALVSY